jgi:hypothetical protein
VKPIILKESDFFSIDEIPRIQPESTPKFINENWLDTQTEILRKNFDTLEDDAVGKRISPMTLVAHSGAGSYLHLIQR